MSLSVLLFNPLGKMLNLLVLVLGFFVFFWFSSTPMCMDIPSLNRIKLPSFTTTKLSLVFSGYLASIPSPSRVTGPHCWAAEMRSTCCQLTNGRHHPPLSSLFLPSSFGVQSPLPPRPVRVEYPSLYRIVIL